jgi:DNA polymerase-4
METNRKIIHVDMDAFFAAVEIRDNPQYKGKPIIVGGPPNSRGVVSTCSYEARKYGIHSAMPSYQAYKLCPHGIFIKPNFNSIKEASQIVREIFFEYTDLVEPVSIDEAYLDVTENKKNITIATEIAKVIKKRIFERTKLTASAGVSYKEILEKHPIGKFYGIGKVSEKKMIYLGIRTGKDLKERSLKELIKHFGKVGTFYYNIVRGVDNRPVITHRIRKSLGCERTFAKDISDVEEMLDVLKKISQKISSKMKEKKFKAKTLTVKIKYANFDMVSRSKTLDEAFDKEDILLHLGRKLLLETLGPKCKIRLLGLSISNLVWEGDKIRHQQILDFFSETELAVEDEDE